MKNDILGQVMKEAYCPECHRLKGDDIYGCQCNTIASHAVLSEVRAKLEKRVVYIEKDIEYHDEYILFHDVMKILSEHFR